MKTRRKQFLKTALMAFVSASVLCPSANAQIYQQDYTNYHYDPTSTHWVENRAVYRDNALQRYYVAQTVTDNGANQAWPHLVLNVCDKDMNVLNTWEYGNNQSTLHMDAYDMDEMTALRQIVVVGRYIDEGTQTAPYVTSIDKTTGAMRWFHLFPEMEYLTAIKAGPNYSIVVGRRVLAPADKIHSLTDKTAVIMKLDQNGTIVWERDFEDDKNAMSGYSISGVFNTMLDVTGLPNGEFVATGRCNAYIGGNINDIWDSDAFLVRFRQDGTVIAAKFLGNLMPLSPGGTQAIQYEYANGITFDPTDNTVVLSGVRMDNPQTYISMFCPSPDPFGLWVTKINPYSLMPVWSKQYLAPGATPGGSYIYTVGDAEIDNDGSGNYGVTYNMLQAISDPYLHNDPIITKIDNNGSVVFSRHHFATSSNGETNNVIFRDVVIGFDHKSVVGVGAFETDPTGYYEMWGWNVEAFDNIQMHCQMHDYPVNEVNRPYQVGDVEYRNNMSYHTKPPIDMNKIAMGMKDPCKKILVSMKMADDDGNIVTQVLQDETTRDIVVTVDGNIAGESANPANNKYNIVLINTLGQKVLETQGSGSRHSVDGANLIPGVYYLQVFNGSFKQVHTISIR